MAANTDSKRRSFRKWHLAILMLLGITINYIDRVNISHAVLPMSRDLQLSPFEIGLVLSAFSWGYVLFMPFGGILADRIGAYRIAGAAALAWSFATIWTGTATSFASLIASRVAVGAGEAPAFPANASLVRRHYDIAERGRATALFDGGSYIGIAISAPIVVFIITTLNWRYSFFITGALGVLWSMCWFLLRRRLTEYQPVPGLSDGENGISPAEYWDMRRLVLNRKVIGCSIGFFCYNYAKSFYLTWFPAYLVSEKGFTFLSIGIVGAIPAICAFLAALGAGHWTDTRIRAGMSVSLARKIPICVGLIFGAILLAADFTNSKTAVLILLTLSFMSVIAASPSIWAIPGDIAPTVDYVARIGGIQNTFSNVAGIVAPITTGVLLLVSNSYLIPLAVTAALSIFGAFSYWFVVGIIEPVRPRVPKS